MIAALVVTLLAADAAATPAPAPAAAAPATTEASTTNADVKVEEPAEPAPLACGRWKSPGLMEGPVAVGYAAADLVVGRRACPRSEAGIGFNFGMIVDTPNFYGNVGSQLVVHGSWALNDKTEIFATFAAVDWEYNVNAVICSAPVCATSLGALFANPNVGDFTLGVARQVYQTPTLAGAVSARLLLPTASNIPGTRNTGAEIGHSVSMRIATFLEAHGYAGLGFTVGLGPVALPGPLLVGTLGAQLSPLSFLSLVVDLSGGLANRSWFAATAALRFRILKVGIEVGATKPLAGTDRHLLIGELRLAFRL